MKLLLLGLVISQMTIATSLFANEVIVINEAIRFPELHSKHHKSIGKGQLKDIAFGGDNILWMIDNRFLWRWNFLTGSLKKIDLSKDLKLELYSIELVKDELVLFAEKVFYFINIKTLKIRRVVNPSSGKKGPVFVTGDYMHWADLASAWKFSMTERTLKRLSALSGIRPTDIVYHSPSSERTFIARQNFIILSQKINGKTSQKIIHKMTNKVEQVFVDREENIFFVSEDVVLRMNPSGKVVQAIPTVGQRIGTSVLTEKFHAYFLPKKQIMEIYNLNKQAKFQVSIPKTSLDIIKIRSKFIGVLSSGKPEVYYIENL